MRAKEFLSELSTEKLAQYKKASYVDARKADAEGDYKRGDKRFKGINKATIKQFDNDLKKHNQQGVAEGSEQKRHETIKNIMQSKDTFIGFIKSQNNSVDEAANAAQQAAIAIAKKKDKKVDENFADGKNPEHKGDSKRHHVPTKGKISTLKKIAKQGGRRGELAHWMANMRSGKKKHNKE